MNRVDRPADFESAEARRRADKIWRRTLEGIAVALADPSQTIPSRLEEWADRYGERPALVGRARRLSFRALSQTANRVSRWALSRGVRKGEVVALMTNSGPDYAALWLGLTRVGAVAALIPPDLRGKPLAHAIRAASGKVLIASQDYAPFIAALEPGPELTRVDESALQQELLGVDGAPLSASERRDPHLRDPALLVFTSGTTGLPKAAHVGHARIARWSYWFSGLAEMGPRDRLYNCLPMHHSVGGVAALLAPLVNGGSTYLAERFSARNFWQEVARAECTIVQYIGELCRYLVAQPPSAFDRAHRVRLAVGNGLSAEVWRPFLERFAVPRVLEFYASTEGNVSLANLEGRVGAIGRAARMPGSGAPFVLVAFDAEAELPWRDETGFCRRCERGEVGEALGRIAPDSVAEVDGYTDKSASELKILRDVFVKGDAFWRSGDLMREDEDGFFTFVDRIGETFRWKGENVSVQQVEATLRACPGVADAVVYGVSVPGAEGKAGMAALSFDDSDGFNQVEGAVSLLPPHARPLVIRLSERIQTTGTFKPRRAALAEEGMDPDRIADRLFLYDRPTGKYLPLTREVYSSVVSGARRL